MKQLIQKVFKEVAGVDVKLPIERMPYKVAMEKYGSDKPDLRFGMEINDLSETVKDVDFKVFQDALSNGGSVRAIKAENCAGMGRKQIDKLVEFIKTYGAKGLAWIAYKEDEIKSSVSKFVNEEQTKAILDKIDAKVGDLVLIVADKNSVVFQGLGALRLHMAKELGILENNKEFRFVWITEFPLLSL